MLSKQQLDEYRKDIQFQQTLCDIPLQFNTTWGVFSPREIDAGTLLLLSYIDLLPTDDCFDLGCGYGPIGITMASIAHQGQTLMTDKDFIAVDYSNKNIKRNHLKNASAVLSNGFQHIDPEQKFDVIASNIPAKVGKEMMSLMLHDAYKHLKPGGKIYLVTINGLRQYMKRNLMEIFENYKKLKQGKSYTVAVASKLSRWPIL
jgi:16S rRNA G1207 methylase RsmC